MVAEVLSARVGDRNPSTDERFEKKRGGIAGRGSNVSNRATGGGVFGVCH